MLCESHYSLYLLSFLICILLCITLPHHSFFFFNDPATTEIYTLSLHDALPICIPRQPPRPAPCSPGSRGRSGRSRRDRKSTRLNSSHRCISYAVFCLKKKKKNKK